MPDDVPLPDFDARIPKDQRWVCPACGKYTLPGQPRSKLGDTSCVTWAVLCWADRTVEGWWEPVFPDDGPPSSGCQSFKT